MWNQFKGIVQEHVQRQSRILDWGIAPLPERMSGEQRLLQWLAEGCHGDMDWMQAYANQRCQPSLLLPGARSALVFLWSYPQPLRSSTDPAPVRIAAYAQGLDYHYELGAFLRELCQNLSESFPALGCRHFVDTLPVLEREVAVLAGLGQFGRNSLLLHPRYGSAFFIGGILCDCALEFTPCSRAPSQDPCAACHRCIDACPTQAIRADRTIDARRCISYLTIENRAPLNEQECKSLGNWLFGCDICQSVCPYNQRHLDQAKTFWPQEREAWELLLQPGQGLRSRLRGTPLQRAGRKGLQRNWDAINR